MVLNVILSIIINKVMLNILINLNENLTIIIIKKLYKLMKVSNISYSNIRKKNSVLIII